jgi:hypothetical protein
MGRAASRFTLLMTAPVDNPVVDDVAAVLFKATLCADCVAAVTSRPLPLVYEALTQVVSVLVMARAMCDHCRARATTYQIGGSSRRRGPGAATTDLHWIAS